MKTLAIGNIEFNIEMIVGSPVGQLIIMHSAKCLETGTVYNKKKANEYYWLYSSYFFFFLFCQVKRWLFYVYIKAFYTMQYITHYKSTSLNTYNLI